jgi:hypothetical protein
VTFQISFSSIFCDKLNFGQLCIRSDFYITRFDHYFRRNTTSPGVDVTILIILSLKKWKKGNFDVNCSYLCRKSKHNLVLFLRKTPFFRKISDYNTSHKFVRDKKLSENVCAEMKLRKMGHLEVDDVVLQGRGEGHGLAVDDEVGQLLSQPDLLAVRRFGNTL